MKKKEILTLDLHGLLKGEAEIKLENFFINLQSSKIEEVKIITGWGRSNEPVLFSFVKDWLSDRGYSFSSDAGSFVVKLKQGQRKFLSV